MRTTTLRVLAAAGLALALAACGQDSVRQGTGDAEGGTIGIAMPTRSSERWIADGNNMVKQFEKAGYETDLQYGQDDVDNQVSQIENMIAKGDKALVVAAIDGASLTDVLQQAKHAGIPVISYDRLITGTKNVDYYATFDNFKVGVLQGRYIVEKLGLTKGEKGPFTLEVFAGSPDDNNSKYFFRGAMSVLQPYIDEGALEVRSGQTAFNQVTTLRWDGGLAQARMENLLSRAYTKEDLDAVLSPYDGISIGVLSALKSVGYGSGSKPLPIVTGQDAELASVKSIIAGEQTQTVYKDTRKLAGVAVDMTKAALRGKQPRINDRESYDNGVKVVPSYLLEPVSVDKSNYHEVLVEGGYYTEAELKG
ncbi:MAG: multiple monosaccharide ABC transporter substrate-binding protein [Actinomycetes bacterium]